MSDTWGGFSLHGRDSLYSADVSLRGTTAAVAVYLVDANGNQVSSGTNASSATAPAQTSVGTTASTILAANSSRIQVIVQNTGTTVIKLALGATPTQTVYHVALQACSSADNGTGGTLVVTELT